MKNVPKKVLLSQRIPGRLSREEQLLADHAKLFDIPVVTATEKMMERNKIELKDDYLVAGTVPFVLQAMRRLGIKVPEHNPYPVVLNEYLHRKVWRQDRLRDVLAVRDKGGSRVFVKPADGWKRFTGFVVEFSSDYRLNGTSKNLPVWVSEPIEFVSEWRAYVANETVLDIRFADHGGDRSFCVDANIVEEAVSKLVKARCAPSGFVIDFGVTSSGETALIEMNDGFSFGAYDGVSAKTYWDVTKARWFELLGNAEKNEVLSN